MEYTYFIIKNEFPKFQFVSARVLFCCAELEEEEADPLSRKRKVQKQQLISLLSHTLCIILCVSVDLSFFACFFELNILLWKFCLEITFAWLWNTFWAHFTSPKCALYKLFCTVIPLLVVVFVNYHERYFLLTTMLLYQLAGVLTWIVCNLGHFLENVLT